MQLSENMFFLLIIGHGSLITDFPGSHAAVVPPVPIPNTAVKRCRADGSACIACARVGHCRGYFKARPEEIQDGLSLSEISNFKSQISALPYRPMIRAQTKFGNF